MAALAVAVAIAALVDFKNQLYYKQLVILERKVLFFELKIIKQTEKKICYLQNYKVKLKKSYFVTLFRTLLKNKFYLILTYKKKV